MTMEKAPEQSIRYVRGKSQSYQRTKRLRMRDQLRRKRWLERREKQFGTENLTDEERGRLQELRSTYG